MAQASYFDYLDEYGEALNKRLGSSVSVDKIAFWRQHGLSDLDAVTAGCRKIAEHALNALVDDDLIREMKLEHKIDFCTEKGIIDRCYAMKFHQVRKTGNRGAHESVKVFDAQMSLALIDDLFRYLIRKWDIDGSIPLESERKLSSIFITCDEKVVSRLVRKARTASLITGNDDLEREARDVVAGVVEVAAEQSEKLEALAERAQQIAGLSGSGEVALQEAELKKCDEELRGVIGAVESIEDSIRSSEIAVASVLSEVDYVQKLLEASGNVGQATESQFEVMSFPRTQRATTNVLLLNGSAGTGKTLCLIAKLILDLRTGKISEATESKKRALFLCFNRSLAGYVRGILSKFPDKSIDIEVVSYDDFVNQLVRKDPKKEYSHLASYASNVRYDGPPFWGPIYGADADMCIRKAMQEVAKEYPDQRDRYYLNTSSSDDVAWVREELRWLDSRYMDPTHADRIYPTASRIGRGNKHLPSEPIRRIILEIWRQYNKILLSCRKYTVEQTTKRLMNADSLPQYDSIAVDEVQDFSVSSVKLILRFRKTSTSRVYISGDEKQKIYQRDFTWKELGESVRGFTITLHENMRNSDAIRRFANRLNGEECNYAVASDRVHVSNRSDEDIVSLVKAVLAKTGSEQTTAIIGNEKKWRQLVGRRGIGAQSASEGTILNPGLYLVPQFKSKGLEFDNVIVDYDRTLGEDEEAENRLRYVHFSRARKRLYIRYEGDAPQLLQKYYPDFLNIG